MMALTRLDGATFYVNPHLVETVEATPDTVIMLVNGHRYVVREAVDQVIRAWREAEAKSGGRGAAFFPAARGDDDGQAGRG
jgi:flagellar protein FlbD